MNSPLKQNTTKIQELLNKINNLPEAGGVELPELSNEGSAADLLSGKELINADGNKVTGTFNIDTELSAQDDLIAQIQAAVDNLPEAAEPSLQSKTVIPSTSTQTVTADNGYDGLDTVTVNAIPSTYVKPTATKSATTYTPSTSNQTIAAGTYCSGIQTIKGDANLVASNIKSGVSIFGVSGSYEGSSGGSDGDSSFETCTVKIQMGMAPPGDPLTAYYTDINFAPQILNAFGSFTVPKNTIVAIEGWSSMASVSGATQLFYHMGFAAYQITTNAVFTLE